MHHDELSARERAVLFALLSAARKLSNAELQALIGIRLDGKERRKLNDLKLVESEKPGRWFVHELSDAGWRWCADELAAGPEGRPTSLERSLYLMLGMFDRYMAAARLSLADVASLDLKARPAGRHKRRDTAEGDGDLTARVAAAYQALTPGPGEFVRLWELRERLADIPRPALDGALGAMFTARRVNLHPAVQPAGADGRGPRIRAPHRRRAQAPDLGRVANRPAMSTEEQAALAALTFNWTRSLNDVWAPARSHVEGLHTEVSEDIRRAIAEADAGDANPLGIVIQGQRGVGKTHLLGWTREQVQRVGGFFFLVGDLSAKAFWEELLGCVVEQLLPLPDGSRDQLRTLLTALADRVGLDPVIRDAVTGQTAPAPVTLRVFIRELRRIDPRIGLICQDTARALVLLASPDQADQDVGYYFMTGNEVDQEDRRRWGIHATRSVPRLLVTELSRLLAVCGPTVIAIDQIDALIDELVGQASDAGLRSRALAEMGTGLMTLRDRTFRTLTIVSALPESWDAIRTYGTDAVVDRFAVPRQLRNIPSADVGRLIIEKRFRADYFRAGFEPPYPTWPILPSAFADASRFTARALVKRVEAHVSACLRDRAVTELAWLDAAPESADTIVTDGTVTSSADDGFAALDARFAELRADAAVTAAVRAALDPESEDAAMPGLLAAGFEAWARELGDGADHPFAQDPSPGKNPRLHASLRLVLDARTERHRSWAFRAIAADHPRAVQSRLRKAAEASGLDACRPDRHLFVLRNAPWPTGKVTEQETAGFAAKGGVVMPARSRT